MAGVGRTGAPAGGVGGVGVDMADRQAGGLVERCEAKRREARFLRAHAIPFFCSGQVQNEGCRKPGFYAKLIPPSKIYQSNLGFHEGSFHLVPPRPHPTEAPQRAQARDPEPERDPVREGANDDKISWVRPLVFETF